MIQKNRQHLQIFLAGIIQGSATDDSVESQDYRQTLKTLFSSSEKVDVYCPVENHPDSIAYDDQKAREVFFSHLQIVRDSDVLIVYLPSASMGTAVEMWEAYDNKRLIITISPMAANWVIRLLSDMIFPDIPAFENFVASGAFKQLVRNKYPHKMM